jgi:hypothetical protein
MRGPMMIRRVKNTKAWRYPLPRWGQYAMGCFYFTIPVVGGFGFGFFGLLAHHTKRMVLFFFSIL